MPLQTLLSLQLVPPATGTFATPLTGSQLSVVQGFWSFGSSGALATQAPPELQTSAPLQRSLSAQLAPGVGWCWTPATGSHSSRGQGFWSSGLGGVPGWQTAEALQSSAPLHTVLSAQLVPGGSGAWATPVAGLQLSAVQGLPSSMVDGVPTTQTPAPLQSSVPLHRSASAHEVPAETGLWATPVTGSQLSAVHALPSSTMGGVPALQLPAPLQISLPLQAFASLQLVPAETGTCATPLAALQLSAVHGFASSTTGGVPGWHIPLALHSSVPSQALPFAQDVPAATGTWATPAAGVQLSAVHGLPSSIGGAVPGVQTAVALQTSLPLQALASLQLVPAATGTWVTPEAGTQLSVVQGFESSMSGGVPLWQAPVALQVSEPLQRLLSLQLVPAGLGVWMGWPAELQLSSVQGLLSS